MRAQAKSAARLRRYTRLCEQFSIRYRVRAMLRRATRTLSILKHIVLERRFIR